MGPPPGAGDGDGGDDDDGDGGTPLPNPTPPPNVGRDNISNKGTPSIRPGAAAAPYPFSHVVQEFIM